MAIKGILRKGSLGKKFRQEDKKGIRLGRRVCWCKRKEIAS